MELARYRNLMAKCTTSLVPKRVVLFSFHQLPRPIGARRGTRRYCGVKSTAFRLRIIKDVAHQAASVGASGLTYTLPKTVDLPRQQGRP